MTIKDYFATTTRQMATMAATTTRRAMMTLLDAHPERFTTILSNLISQQDYYRELVRDRQRQNKRVWIYSDEVGNHNYALASGWTWLRLAQENPKQLAPAALLPTPVGAGPGAGTDKRI